MHLSPLGNVDLNLLVVLEALLEERNGTRAAKRLGLSQPAVSHALSRLRDLFGDPLFTRTQRGLQPTARAEGLAQDVRLALDTVRRALRSQDFDPTQHERTFVVSASDLAELVILPPLLERIGPRARGVRLVVRPTNPLEIDGLLAAGALDLALGVHGEPSPGFHTLPLFRDELVCVMRRGHPLSRKTFDLDAFVSARHLLVAPRGTPGGRVDDRLAELGRVRDVELTVPHFLVAPHLIVRTDLVWTAPQRLATTFRNLLPLVVRKAPLELPPFFVGALWHERRHKDPAHEWLRNELAASSDGVRRPLSLSHKTGVRRSNTARAHASKR